MTSRQDRITELTPRKGWLDIDLAGLWQYRDLLRLLVRRDFVAYYKQTILGPLWYLVQPLTSTLVFTVIFGMVAKLPTDGLPPFLFYLSGLVPWAYFSNCAVATSGTFTSNVGLFGKVYFPRLILPISVVTTNLFTFSIQFCLFLAFLVYFKFAGATVAPNWLWIIFFPALLVQIGLLGIGIGAIVSSLTTKYRDLSLLVNFGIQLWMYMTPVVYPVSQVPERWQWVYRLNPMAGVVETFRAMFLGGPGPGSAAILSSVLVTLAILFAGVVIFNRVERTFVDTI